MALSDRTNLLVQQYVRRQYPELEDGLRRYLSDEFQRIEPATSSLANASIQVADAPPENPVKGMVRFATTGWEPLGNGTTNFLVVYNGTAWVAV